MKAIVDNKKNLTLVSYMNGVMIVEASGCTIDLNYNTIASICDLAGLNDSYTIVCSELEPKVAKLESDIASLTNELNLRAEVIREKDSNK